MVALSIAKQKGKSSKVFMYIYTYRNIHCINHLLSHNMSLCQRTISDSSQATARAARAANRHQAIDSAPIAPDPNKDTSADAPDPQNDAIAMVRVSRSCGNAAAQSRCATRDLSMIR
jgi:hypothetical protein